MKNKNMIKRIAVVLPVILCAALGLMGCSSNVISADQETTPDLVTSATPGSGGTMPGGTMPGGGPAPGSDGSAPGFGGFISGSGEEIYTGELPDGSALVDADELFSDRDLEQEPDLSKAVTLTLQDGQDETITEAGVYVLRGTAKNAAVIVDAAEDAKIQLVLDGVSIENEDFPCIYVKSADKVFVTTVADSSLSVTGSFRADGEINTDAVIFSKQDLVLNGTAKLVIQSSCHGVVSKDDLKITGGSYEITATEKGLEANDSIRIVAAELTLTTGDDGIHAENDGDDSLGWIYIGSGTFTIDSGDDGIHAVAFVQIDGGDFTIKAAEGIESSYVQIDGGDISISSWDDGINAACMSTAYPICVVVNGGNLTIVMGAGDTDGIDSNGGIIVNGGVINITGNSSFDYESSAQFNGGTIIVNGQELSSIPNQMFGGPGMGGGPGGGPGQGGGRPGGGRR